MKRCLAFLFAMLLVGQMIGLEGFASQAIAQAASAETEDTKAQWGLVRQAVEEDGYAYVLTRSEDVKIYTADNLRECIGTLPNRETPALAVAYSAKEGDKIDTLRICFFDGTGIIEGYVPIYRFHKQPVREESLFLDENPGVELSQEEGEPQEAPLPAEELPKWDELWTIPQGIFKPAPQEAAEPSPEPAEEPPVESSDELAAEPAIEPETEAEAKAEAGAEEAAASQEQTDEVETPQPAVELPQEDQVSAPEEQASPEIAGETTQEPETQASAETESAASYTVVPLVPIRARTLKSKVALRKVPSVDSERVERVADKGTNVTINGKADDAEGTLWYQVIYKDVQGFVRSDLLALQEPAVVDESADVQYIGAAPEVSQTAEAEAIPEATPETAPHVEPETVPETASEETNPALTLVPEEIPAETFVYEVEEIEPFAAVTAFDQVVVRDEPTSSSDMISLVEMEGTQVTATARVADENDSVWFLTEGEAVTGYIPAAALIALDGAVLVEEKAEEEPMGIAAFGIMTTSVDTETQERIEKNAATWARLASEVGSDGLTMKQAFPDDHFREAVYTTILNVILADQYDENLEREWADHTKPLPFADCATMTWVEVVGNYTGTINASGYNKTVDKKVALLDGVKYLRWCLEVDLSYNKIKDITPLAGGISIGDPAVAERFSKVNLDGNPIQIYPEEKMLQVTVAKGHTLTTNYLWAANLFYVRAAGGSLPTVNLSFGISPPTGWNAAAGRVMKAWAWLTLEPSPKGSANPFTKTAAEMSLDIVGSQTPGYALTFNQKAIGPDSKDSSTTLTIGSQEIPNYHVQSVAGSPHSTSITWGYRLSAKYYDLLKLAAASESVGGFRFVKKHAFKNALDEDVLLKGAVYGLYSDAACEEEHLIATYTTQENGEFAADNLELGTYYLKELSAPDGFKLNDDVLTIVIQGPAGMEPEAWEATGGSGTSVNANAPDGEALTLEPIWPSTISYMTAEAMTIAPPATPVWASRYDADLFIQNGGKGIEITRLTDSQSESPDEDENISRRYRVKMETYVNGSYDADAIYGVYDSMEEARDAVNALIKNNLLTGTVTIESILSYSMDSDDYPEYSQTDDPEEIELTLSAFKVLDGETLTANMFDFVLAPYQNPDPREAQTASNDKDGNIVFEKPLVFTKPGTYVYVMQEIKPDQENPWIEYDLVERIITIVVTATKEGLTAAVTIQNGQDGESVPIEDIEGFFTTFYNSRKKLLIDNITTDRNDNKKTDEGGLVLTVEGASAEHGEKMEEDKSGYKHRKTTVEFVPKKYWQHDKTMTIYIYDQDDLAENQVHIRAIADHTVDLYLKEDALRNQGDLEGQLDAHEWSDAQVSYDYESMGHLQPKIRVTLASEDDMPYATEVDVSFVPSIWVENTTPGGGGGMVSVNQGGSGKVESGDHETGRDYGKTTVIGKPDTGYRTDFEKITLTNPYDATEIYTVVELPDYDDTDGSFSVTIEDVLFLGKLVQENGAAKVVLEGELLRGGLPAPIDVGIPFYRDDTTTTTITTPPPGTSKTPPPGRQLDPDTPKTSDDTNFTLWIALMGAGLVGILLSMTLGVNRRQGRRK